MTMANSGLKGLGEQLLLFVFAWYDTYHAASILSYLNLLQVFLPIVPVQGTPMSGVNYHISI